MYRYMSVLTDDFQCGPVFVFCTFCLARSFVFLSNYSPLMWRAEVKQKSKNVCKMSLDKTAHVIECACITR